MVWTAVPAANAEAPVKIVALGDSLTAGLGLPEKEGFVPRLQAALAAKGMAVEIENAGVSGDTSADGLAVAVRRSDGTAPIPTRPSPRLPEICCQAVTFSQA